MGLGPTYGIVAGDPTQNLGGLGPQLQQQLLSSMDDANTAGRRGGGLSEGDADVRGRHAQAVNEDADMPLRPGAGSGSGSGSWAGGLADAADEYSPEGLDVLDAGGGGR
jgi:hypothetical protein